MFFLLFYSNYFYSPFQVHLYLHGSRVAMPSSQGMCGVYLHVHTPFPYLKNRIHTGCGRYLRTNGDMEQKFPFCTVILTHWNETIHRYSTNPPLSVYSMKPPSASTVVPMWLRKQLHAQIRGASCILPVTCTMTSFSGSLVSSRHFLVSFSKTPHT